MTAEFILLITGAYVLGSLPAAQVAAKLYKGIDLKKFGSGNVGVSNLVRATSKWVAIPVVIFDFSKGMALVYLAAQLGLLPYQQVSIGLAAVIGHNWPVFLRFNGGRGVLTSLGVAVALEPRLTAMALAVAVIFWLLHEVALGVLVVTALLPAASLLFSSPLNVDAKIAVTMGFAAIFILVVIRRLTAPLSPMATTLKKKELLLNRFLFDRDIRDRKAWVTGLSSEAPAAGTQDEPEKTIK